MVTKKKKDSRSMVRVLIRPSLTFQILQFGQFLVLVKVGIVYGTYLLKVYVFRYNWNYGIQRSHNMGNKEWCGLGSLQ